MANFLGSTEAPWVDAPLHAVSHAENNCMPQDETRSSLKDFDTKASILYLVSMSTFWILTVATGKCDRCALCKHETCSAWRLPYWTLAAHIY